MQTAGVEWSELEQEIARNALKTAYRREVESLISEVQAQVSHLSTVDAIWKLHDFLSVRRHTLDGKYDEREISLVFVLSQLIQEGWLTLTDLEGLSHEKVAKVSALTRLSSFDRS